MLTKFPKFTLVARTKGKYQASFVFTDNTELEKFKNTLFKDLINEYGPLQLTIDSLPGLQLGDRCKCLGEGGDVLTVEGARMLSPYRWSFALSHGCWEEAAKCYEKVEHRKILNIPEEILQLREALTQSLIALHEAHGYAVMDDRTLQKVSEAIDTAETCLQRTDSHTAIPT